MIIILAVNWTPILDCSQDAGKTTADTASDAIVMGAVRTLYELSLLVIQRNHSDLSLCGRCGHVHKVQLCAALLQPTEPVTRRWHK
jgi:hypothetical protein